MKSDYEILGLKEGADEKEIKRAYFKLVRQFPPEKEPERFQEIREAYENLKSGKANKGFQLKFPSDSTALKVVEMIENKFKQRNYQYVMDTAERAASVFGEYEGFLYFLAMAQRKLGFSGKSVQNFEKLVKMNPDSVEFAKELAYSYMERGYGRKAYTAFGKAYDMGCRELDFLNSYAMNCEDRKDYRRGQDLLFELVSLGMSNLKEYVDDQVNAYTGLFNLCLSLNGERLQEIEEGFIKFLELASPYLRSWAESLEWLIHNALYADKKFHPCEGNFLDSMKEALAKGIGSEKTEEVVVALERNVEVLLIDQDGRMSEIIKIVAENFKSGYEESQLDRFAQLDCKLCMIEEWPGIKKELRILEECYPNVYKDIKEFEDKLEHTEKLDILRDRYLKEYDRLVWYINGGVYYKRYPYRKKQEKIIADSGFGGQPYTRMQPKVGRNDPCPCGSGKKYKKCCGK